MKNAKLGKTVHPVTPMPNPPIGGGTGNAGGASKKIIGNVNCGTLGGGKGNSGGTSKQIISKVGK